LTGTDAEVKMENDHAGLTREQDTGMLLPSVIAALSSSWLLSSTSCRHFKCNRNMWRNSLNTANAAVSPVTDVLPALGLAASDTVIHRCRCYFC